jgi:diguanylate cyclase (GGDEF)-like protein
LNRTVGIRPLLYPALGLLLQFAIFFLAPSAVSHAAAYALMVVAPLLAAGVIVWRGRLEQETARIAWYAVALSLAIWALGSLGNLWQELILGHANEMYRTSMLAFNLSAVPLAFVLAGDWRITHRPLARLTDAVIASTLGYGFFLYTWAVLTARGEPDDSGVIALIWLLDVQNLFLTLGAVARLYSSDTATERRLFSALLVYQVLYEAILFYNNHYVAGDPAYGIEQACIVNFAFAALAVVALSPADLTPSFRPDPRIARTIRAASPMLLAGALLLVALFMIRVDYSLGCIGILIAAVGYTLRTSLNQARHIERGDVLLRERGELEAIASTDALTGLANRYMLDRALARLVAGDEGLRQTLSVLMVDIDLFKNLNDHYGHPTGDACLRSVSAALQQALARPDDLVARYGGEEFVVLIEDTDAAGALVVAERLRSTVAALGIENVASPVGIVTVSVGAATVLRGERANPSDLVGTADRALYIAKRAGRNQIHGLLATTP